MARHRQEGDSNPPIDLSRVKWTMSTTNFWAIIVMITGGIVSYYDLKTDNKVRDTVISANSVRIATTEMKLTAMDIKLTETRELMIKASSQLDSISSEQVRVARALEHAVNRQ